MIKPLFVTLLGKSMMFRLILKAVYADAMKSENKRLSS